MRAVALLGCLVRDVVLTGDELRGLMANLLVSSGPPTGRRRLSEWVTLYGEHLGLHYANELARNYR
jgi:NADH dehydrogenase